MKAKIALYSSCAIGAIVAMFSGIGGGPVWLTSLGSVVAILAGLIILGTKRRESTQSTNLFRR